MRRHFAVVVAVAVVVGLGLARPALADEPPVAEHDLPGRHELPATCAAASSDEECAEYWEENVNFWSWDYKSPVADPAHRHMPPPFGFALINFAVFALIMYRLAAKPLKEFVRTRHVTIKKDLDDAAATKAEATAKLREYEAKIAGIDAEVAALVAQIRREAEGDKARILAAAAEQAARLTADAEAQVKAEIARIQRALRREAVEAAVKNAEEVLRAQLGADDQKRIADRYLADLDAQPGGFSTVAPS